MSESSEPDLTKPYDPAAVERPERWYAFWEKHGVFEAHDSPTDARPAYVVPMPPPNVTGSLHMGPRAHLHARGRARSLASDARLQRALAAGDRPRRDRHPDRGRAAARAGRDEPPRARTRGVRGAGLE